MQLTIHKPSTILTIDNFFTSEECDNQIAWSEKRGYKGAKINSMGRQVTMINVRNNSRVMFTDEALAESIWQKVQPYCVQQFSYMQAIGLNEMWRFYKYTVGQQFKRHIDGSYERNETESSLYTLMIYLNDDFLGGDTWFEDLVIQPQKSMALLFKHDLLHEGRKVIKGTKYVLRTDVIYRFEKK